MSNQRHDYGPAGCVGQIALVPALIGLMALLVRKPRKGRK